MDLHRLSDGRPIHIRSIRPDDAERLRASHRRLSPDSNYRRFLGFKPHLTEAEARRLVGVDGRDHFALVAVDEDRIVGVARCIRLPDDPAAAEYAIVVGDAYQRQGLGAALTRALVAGAARRGITRLRAVTLADNVAVRRLLLGVAEGPPRVRYAGHTTEVEVDLAPQPPPAQPAGA